MNFTVEVKNIPLSDKVAETWWQALWLPFQGQGQSLSSPWFKPNTLRYTFSGADPKGDVHIDVWGRVPDPEGIQDYWIKIAEKDITGLSLKEGETVIVDMAAGMGLSLPLVLGGLAVGGLVLAVVLRRR